MKNVARIGGYLRATADATHPLQTRLSLILTDFAPNFNKQAIPETEKDNIINSALHMPIKINFKSDAAIGHLGAFPIGPIISVYESEDNGRAVIKADAIIWNEVYGDIADYIKQAFAEGVGTSWEIYYQDSELDALGNEWLKGTVFAGTCIVDTPAYGPNRTRLLAVAEKLKERNADLENLMVKNEENMDKKQAEDLSDTRRDISDAQTLLFQILDGLDSLYNQTFEIEEATIERDLPSVADDFSTKVGKIADRLNELSATAEKVTELESNVSVAQAELESVTRERDALLEEKNQAAAERDRAAKLNDIRAKLLEAGFDITESAMQAKASFYLKMTDEDLSQYVEDLNLVSARHAQAEDKRKKVIPEPLSSERRASTAEIAAALRQIIS